MTPLLRITDCGLFCEDADFYIDPWKSVDKAIITHAHSDHARPGMKSYLSSNQSRNILTLRLGNINLQTVHYNEPVYFNNIKVTLHPAGHILGSSQVRIERNGEVWVVTGDYKLEEDKVSTPFELIKCNTFITESTFGLPIYHWQAQDIIFHEINNWWSVNKENKRASIIYGYALGKAQRILSGLDPSIGPILTHGAVENINNCYRKEGVYLPETVCAGNINDKNVFSESIIIAPPGDNAFWSKKIGEMSSAFASGWVQIRGNRRRLSQDRGFVLSDHVDWDSLLLTIKDTGAENIFVTHGYTETVVKWLSEKGYNAKVLPAQFSVEDEGEGIPRDKS